MNQTRESIILVFFIANLYNTTMQHLHPRALWQFFLANLILLPATFFMLSFFFFYVLLKFETGTESISGSFSLIQLLGTYWWIFLPLYVGICYLLAWLTYQNWKYELTADAIRIERGVISKKYVSIPYERVQNVDIYRGLLSRILGLSDLHVQTAGASGGVVSEGNFPGLSTETAEKMRSTILDHTK